jgi:NAD(P)-dependent dehydrogenase (short-subunit alcohol dehydrogenase family)
VGPLQGKVAIVTGASAGLGAACAVELARAGADVAIAARRADKLRETQARIEQTGRSCVAVPADVTRPEECDELVRQAIDGLGRVDVLVNNAGVATSAPSTRETPAQFRAVLDVNLFGSYWMAQACARVMKPGSAIVNIGSVLGLTSGRLPQAAYSSSKAGIIGLTRDLAQQWTGRKGIRVNALAPGFFHSEMTAAYPDGYMDSVLQRIPARRAGEPREFAAAVIFLASDAASYITGVVLPVDGGLLTN